MSVPLMSMGDTSNIPDTGAKLALMMDSTANLDIKAWVVNLVSNNISLIEWILKCSTLYTLARPKIAPMKIYRTIKIV